VPVAVHRRPPRTSLDRPKHRRILNRMCLQMFAILFGAEDERSRHAREILDLGQQLQEYQNDLETEKHHHEAAQRKVLEVSKLLKQSKDYSTSLENDQDANDARVLQAEAKVKQANRKYEDLKAKQHTTTKTSQADQPRKDLEDKVRTLTAHLKSSHDHIFSLQPLPPVILGPEAGRQFSSFCETVEEWVQTNLGDAIEDRIIFKGTSIDKQAAAELLALISPSGTGAFQVPGSDEYYVIAAIMRFLCREIFDKEFYCDMGELVLVRSLQESIQKLKPPRGKFWHLLALTKENRANLFLSKDRKAIRTWRSETLTALANSPHFPSLRRKRIQALAAQLTRILSILIPSTSPDGKKALASIDTTIIEPAVELAEKFQLSVDLFSIEWTSGSFTDNESFSSFQCQNLLPPNRKLKFPAAKQGNCITYVCDIAPQLVNQLAHALDSEAPKIEKQAKILVAVTKEQDGPFKGQGLRLENGEYVTLLGQLEAHLSRRP